VLEGRGGVLEEKKLKLKDEKELYQVIISTFTVSFKYGTNVGAGVA
jgi:hypothetical protein